MATPSEISKTIRLNLSDIPEESRERAKTDVGEFVVNEILRFVSRGNSPVEGERFPILDSEYADKFKGGNRTPNLELDGDMLDALEFKTTNEGVEVGIFASSQVPKADGHNNFSGESSLPTRRFIPESNQDFRPIIEAGIDSVLRRYRRAEIDVDPLFTLENILASSTILSDVASEDVDIDSILAPFNGDL